MTSGWWDDPQTTRRFGGIDGTELWARDAGDGPVVVLCHGFPELGYSWRQQLPALTAAGYRVLVPDQRGYGRSGRPAAVEAYDIEHLVGDLRCLLDAAGIDRAAVVGHDWGSIVAWTAPQLAPDRFGAVAGLSVPFTPRSKRPPTEIWDELFTDRYFYILDFQEPARADANLGHDPDTTMRRLMGGLAGPPADGGILGGPDDGRGFVERLGETGDLPAWISEAELAFYVEAFAASGFTGGINWYRNFDRNWHRTPQLSDAVVEIPSFFLYGTADPVAQGIDLERMERHLADHRGNVAIEGAGHWVQQESPTQVNEALLGFLADAWPA